MSVAESQCFPMDIKRRETAIEPKQLSVVVKESLLRPCSGKVVEREVTEIGRAVPGRRGRISYRVLILLFALKDIGRGSRKNVQCDSAFMPLVSEQALQSCFGANNL